MADWTCSTASSQAPKPYRISDRHFMSDLRLCMQAWSKEGETLLVIVENTDKFDNSTLSVDCSLEQLGTLEVIPVPSTARDDSKRTTENSSANGRTGGDSKRGRQP